MIASFIFIKFKRLSIPPHIPSPLPGLFPWTTLVCLLVSKYLGIFLIFFCYWPLNDCHCGKRTYFVWLGSFWIWGICFMAQNMVCFGTCPRGLLSTLPSAPWIMRCPALAAGSREHSHLMIAAPASFPLFLLGGSFPSARYFPYFKQWLTVSWRLQGKDLPGSFSGLPLCEVQLLSPAQTHSFPSSSGKTTLLALVPPPWAASSLTESGSPICLHTQRVPMCCLGERTSSLTEMYNVFGKHKIILVVFPDCYRYFSLTVHPILTHGNFSKFNCSKESLIMLMKRDPPMLLVGV